MGVSLVTGPTAEPVSLAMAKAHCRVDISDDDGLIAGYILAARQYAENYTRRAFAPQTWDATFYQFGSRIRLPLPPLQSVTSVQYIDAAGAQQVLAANQYAVIVDGVYGTIVPAYGATWPDTQAVPNAVTVRFVAGYPLDSIPNDIRTAINLHVELLLDREPNSRVMLESARDSLLDFYRVVSVS